MTIPNPFSSGFPLKEDPFRSRIESQINASKNYYGLAFKPGYPLQSQELNEIQEIFYVQTTLNNRLGSVSGFTAGTVPWNGCTPLSTVLVGAEGTTDITATGGTGWYLIQKEDVNGGLGVWVYNSSIKTIISGFTGATGTTGDYGIVVKPLIIGCTSGTSPGANEDNTIADSHNINILNGPCGADRLKLDVIKFGFTAGPGEYLVPIFTANKTGITASLVYKNGLLLREVTVS